MSTAICWAIIGIFIIFVSFTAGLLLADPDLIKILGAIAIILIGIFTTVILILTMPI